MFFVRLLALGSLVCAAFFLSVPLQASENKGYAIAKKNYDSQRGFGDSDVPMQMILRTASGDEATRTLSMQTLEIADTTQGDKTLIIFDSPRDINGTALLSHAGILQPDDQWLFLPSLNRVKRISSANRAGPFVGSEFAYEDFTGQELDKYSYSYLAQETLNGLAMHKIQRVPKYENSGYTQQIMWIDDKDFQQHRIDFYDRKNALLKTMLSKGYKRYPNGVWRAHRLEMVNHQTGKETDLLFETYRFGVGLRDEDFTPNRLRRSR